MLTSDGTKLLPYAKNVVAEYEKLQMKVDELNGLQSGLIRIGTFSSVATHWLPNIIKAFQKDYPNIDYELLLGDYTEIEEWIAEGRVDCGFLRLPTKNDFETVFLEQDRLLAIIPENHPLKDYEKFPVKALCDEPFMLLEKGAKAEISEIFEMNGLTPNVKFTTWDDYAVMSMVESGLGISILPELILKRIPYRIVAKELNVPVICLSQLSRANESRSDKRPQLSDLRESGSIEQDADVVIGLYREFYYNQDAENPNEAEAIILKNRKGETGSIRLNWMPEYTCFANLDTTHEE